MGTELSVFTHLLSSLAHNIAMGIYLSTNLNELLRAVPGSCLRQQHPVRIRGFSSVPMPCSDPHVTT